MQTICYRQGVNKNMLNYFQQLGASGIGFFQRLGRANILLGHILVGIPNIMLRVPLVIKQIHSVGVLSFLIILVSGFFVGMVLVLLLLHSYLLDVLARR